MMAMAIRMETQAYLIEGEIILQDVKSLNTALLKAINKKLQRLVIEVIPTQVNVPQVLHTPHPFIPPTTSEVFV